MTGAFVCLSSPPVRARESWFEDRRLSTAAITSVMIPKIVTLFVRNSSLGHFIQLSSDSAYRERKTYRNWEPWHLFRNAETGGR